MSHSYASEQLSRLRKDGFKIDKISSSIKLNDLILKYYKKKKSRQQMGLRYFSELFKKWNPHLNDQQNLKGQYVYTESPFSPYIGFQYAPSLKELGAGSKPLDFFQAYAGGKEKTKGRLPASQNKKRSKYV